MMFRVLVLLICATAMAETPKWAKEGTFVKNGNNLLVVGIGIASTVELARKDAEKSCLISASDAVNRTYRVKNVTIQTEKGSWINEEVSYSQTVKGLVYKVEQEGIENEAGAYRVWIQCKFDLAKVLVTSQNVDQKEEKSVLTSQKLTSVSVSPKCDSILVIGSHGRAIDCNKNPVTFVSEPGDSKILIRAKNFQSKTVVLKDQSETLGDLYEVVLDR